MKTFIINGSAKVGQAKAYNSQREIDQAKTITSLQSKVKQLEILARDAIESVGEFELSRDRDDPSSQYEPWLERLNEILEQR